MRAFAVAVVALGLSGLEARGSRAELLNSNPSEVCDSLRDAGLATDGWKDSGEDAFICSSRSKFLGSGGAILQNNLTFFALGTRNAVQFVKLSLSVNDREAATSAHRELLEAASRLSVELTGGDLSPELWDAIAYGVDASQGIRSSAVRIRRQPTDTGYVLKVIIE